VWVGADSETKFGIAGRAAPDLGEADVEALFAGEAVDYRGIVAVE